MNEARPNTTGFLFGLQWLVSFIWPVRLDSIKTSDEHLEVILFRGKKLLDSGKANYSYGNLQTAFERCFDEIDVDWSACDDILILGFGAGGVVDLISKRNVRSRCVGVELSSNVIELYQRYFPQHLDVELVNEDALEFVQEDERKFDLIIVDLYQDLEVPMQFHTEAFVELLRDRLSIVGVIVFNKVVNGHQSMQEWNELMLWFSSCFKSVQVNDQMGMNRFILAKGPK